MFRHPATRLKTLLAAAVFSLSALPFAANAGNVVVEGAGAMQFELPSKSFKENMFNGVIRQQYDFSCGSASLATMLYHYYYYDVNERDIIKAMYEAGDKKKILQEGFSLLDMKNYLAANGIPADGYRLTMQQLEKYRIPAIALINANGYLHFVVVSGIYEDMVLVADPSLGMRKISKKDFNTMWNKIAFVIKSDIPLGRQQFNTADNWKFRKSATFDTALSNESLATFSVHTSPTPNYIPF